MVQIVENWAELRGRVISIGQHSDPKFATARLAVEDVVEVEGFPNFFAADKGKSVEVAVPRHMRVRAGADVKLRVRKTPRGAFAI